MWQTIDKSAATEPGTYRFRFAYPAEFLVPDIGTPKTWSIMGYQITLSDWTKNTAQHTVTAIVKVEQAQKYAGLELTAAINNGSMAEGSANPYRPLVRTMSGYAKASSLTVPQGAPVQQTFAPLLIPLAEIALAVAGLAFIYLSLTSVEKLVESPTVNLVLIAGVAIVAYVLYTKVRA